MSANPIISLPKGLNNLHHCKTSTPCYQAAEQGCELCREIRVDAERAPLLYAVGDEVFFPLN